MTTASEVVAADLEGTLTTAETWRSIAEHLKASGQSRRYRNFVLLRLPQVLGARLGLIDRQQFRDRWISDFAGLLAGKSIDDMAALAEHIVAERLWPAQRSVVIEELRDHRREGRAVLLCSGTYQSVLEAFARRLDGEALGTPLENDGSRLSGRVAEAPNTGSRKAQRLIAALDGRTLVAAYGDTMADAFMLEASAEPVAVHPEPGLRRVAVERGWRLIE